MNIIKIDNLLEHCELKFTSDNQGEFKGYASVFNGVDSVKDTILPGAFKKTLRQKRNPSMFVNHDSYNVPVGDWIKLKEDDKGLEVTGKIDLNHKDGITVYSALKRGAMDALSIGFRIPKNGAEENDDGSRTISEIDLKEISIVNFPADEAARIAVVKADILKLESLKDVESYLSDLGWSRSNRTTFVSHFMKLRLRDAEINFHNEVATLESKLEVSDTTNYLLGWIKNL